MTQIRNRLHILLQVVFLKKNRRVSKIAGLLMAAAGAVIVVHATPLFIWYLLLLGLLVLLALVIFMR